SINTDKKARIMLTFDMKLTINHHFSNGENGMLPMIISRRTKIQLHKTHNLYIRKILFLFIILQLHLKSKPSSDITLYYSNPSHDLRLIRRLAKLSQSNQVARARIPATPARFM
ncbi:TPA: hypothetical protein ACG5YK_003005, partial [Escherichia coli]